MLKRFLISLLLLSACSTQQAQQSTTESLLNVSATQALISKDPKIVLLDVRTPEEFAEGHLAKAQNVDFKNANFSEQISKLDPNQSYLLYCASGRRSAAAKELMAAKGFTHLYELQGGISAWSSQNAPVQK